MIKKIIVSVLSLSMLAAAIPAVAATTTPTTAQISCVGAAVNTRESSLDSAISTFTQALNSAYTARATALQKAYTLTPGNGAIKAAVKAAWTAFTSATKYARTDWQKSRKAAWATFRTSVKSCKASGVPTDSANAASEASGN